MKYLTLVIFLALSLSGCQSFEPASNVRSEYPDIAQVLEKQTSGFFSINLKKEVWLDGKTEIQTLVLDTLTWKKELSFLKEIDPSLPEYVGAFSSTVVQDTTHLVLREGERGSLQKFSYVNENDELSSLSATIHEDKDVYVHHRESKSHLQRRSSCGLFHRRLSKDHAERHDRV